MVKTRTLQHSSHFTVPGVGVMSEGLTGGPCPGSHMGFALNCHEGMAEINSKSLKKIIASHFLLEAKVLLIFISFTFSCLVVCRKKLTHSSYYRGSDYYVPILSPRTMG